MWTERVIDLLHVSLGLGRFLQRPEKEREIERERVP